MAEVDDEELERLRADAAKAKDLEERTTQIERQRQEDQQRHQQEMAQVNGYVSQQIAQLNAQRTPEEPEDEEAKLLRQRVSQSVQDTIQPYVAGMHINNRATQKATAKLQFGPLFERFEKEIETMLDAYPPNVSGAPGAYEAAFKAIKAQHADELVKEEVERQVAERTSTPTRRPATAPPRQAAAPTRTAQKQTQAEDGGAFGTLDDDEQRYVQEHLGLNAEEYNKYSDENYSEDILGFKGRSRV